MFLLPGIRKLVSFLGKINYVNWSSRKWLYAWLRNAATSAIHIYIASNQFHDSHNNWSFTILFRRAKFIISTISITFLNVFDKNQVQFFFKLHGSPRQNVVWSRLCSQFKAKRTDGSIEELFQGGTRFYKLHRSEQVSVPNKEIQSV